MSPIEVEDANIEFIDKESNLKDFEDIQNDVITKQPLNELKIQNEKPSTTPDARGDSLLCCCIFCDCLTEWWLAVCGCVSACFENGCAECCNGLCEGFTECLESCGECCILCLECCKN